MANSNNWGEIYKSTWWGDEDWSANSLKIDSAPPGFAFTGLLDTYTGAAAAYSVRKLSSTYTGDALRVRRSSDDTEQDIGFDSNGDLDTTALTTFVNAEYTLADEDFSSSTGWTLGTGVSITGGVLRANTSGTITAYKNFGDPGAQQVRVTFTISNYTSGTVRYINFGTVTLGTPRSTNGTYTEILTLQEGGNVNHGLSFGSFVGDIDNFEIVQLTADGAVTKWYDQSGNSNDAINADASEQPLVVSGGIVVTENDKAAIEFSGNPVYLDASSAIADAFTGNSVYYKFEVAQVTSTSKGGILCANTGYRSFFNPPSYDYANFHNPNGLEVISSLNVDRTNQFLFSESFNANTGGGTYELYGNGSLERSQGSEGTSNLDTPTSVYIGRDPSGGTSGYLVGKIQEIIIFDSDQSSNRTGIETNINDHFDIYTP